MKDDLKNFLPLSSLVPRQRPMSPIRVDPANCVNTLWAGPVPARNRFGSDDDDRLLPLRPQPTDGNQEELVQQMASRPRTTPFQHGQLPSQHEVLKDEIPAEDRKSDPNGSQSTLSILRFVTRVLASGPLLCS